MLYPALDTRRMTEAMTVIAMKEGMTGEYLITIDTWCHVFFFFFFFPFFTCSLPSVHWYFANRAYFCLLFSPLPPSLSLQIIRFVIDIFTPIFFTIIPYLRSLLSLPLLNPGCGAAWVLQKWLAWALFVLLLSNHCMLSANRVEFWFFPPIKFSILLPPPPCLSFSSDFFFCD